MPVKSAAGKSGETPKGRSAPRRKSTERPKGASGRQSKRAAAPAGGRLSTLLPVFTLLLVAAVVLGGLLHWGKSTRAPSPPASATGRTTAQATPKAAQARPDKGAPKQPPAPAAPATAPAPAAPSRPFEPKPPQPAAAEAPRPTDSPPSHPVKSEERLASVAPPAKPIAEPPKPAPAAPVAEVAIVIDDFGQDLAIAEQFLGLPLAITFSVLPFLPHSEEVIRLAGSRGHEVILHVPMEPREYPQVKPGPGALLVSMSAEDIQKTLRTALDAYPNVSGVNNHMGSRFTEKADPMRIVLAELRQRKLFFLDSFTSDKSVGYSLARELNVPSRRRDVFLDHNVSEGFVRAQLLRLIRKAKIQGSAVAIGHPHDATLKVLSQEAARFQQEGIAVVPLGKLTGPASG